MTHQTLLFLSPLLLFAGIAPAQEVVLRDKIVRLPPISICQDGATHKTVVTNVRLRPRSGPLDKYEGKAIEVRGRPGQVTCKFVDVTAVTVLPNDHWSVATTTKTDVRVDFYGTGTGVFMLYLAGGITSAPWYLPPIQGPIHLDPAVHVFLGGYAPLGASNPYLSMKAPTSPVLLNVDFFDQALVVSGAGAETSNVDHFKFQ